MDVWAKNQAIWCILRHFLIKEKLSFFSTPKVIFPTKEIRISTDCNCLHSPWYSNRQIRPFFKTYYLQQRFLDLRLCAVDVIHCLVITQQQRRSFHSETCIICIYDPIKVLFSIISIIYVFSPCNIRIFVAFFCFALTLGVRNQVIGITSITNTNPVAFFATRNVFKSCKQPSQCVSSISRL